SVSEDIPETVTVWHNGKTVLSGISANTGIPGAETELGTHNVYEHLEETTMSGENPDGSHYEDPGIKWVSYFYGGDALHAFDRASYGTPQSLGCVEMPLEDAEAVFPYTPIGTPVTVNPA
ncbi:MAG TPA: L,D-transpeptidase, partial [Solirubrobacterales bacterium]|nr:L,D-transpeptidase [Solirubrobacterales bacterium]